MAKKSNNLPKGITRRTDGRYMWRFQSQGQKYCGYARTIKNAKTGLRNARLVAARMEKVRPVFPGKTSGTLPDPSFKEGAEGSGCISGNAETCVTLNEWFDYWIASLKAGLKETTKQRYRQIYGKYMENELGAMRLDEADPAKMQSFLNTLGETGISGPSLCVVRSLLYHLFESALRYQKVAENPVRYTSLPQVSTKYGTRDAFTDEELESLLRYIRDPEVRQICRFASLTGMRIGEILGLSWRDVDFGRKEIHIRHTLSYYPERGFYLDEPKTAHSRRIIPMMRECEEVLKEAERKSGAERKKEPPSEEEKEVLLSGLVFKTARGRPYFSSNINKELRRAVKQMKESGALPPNRRYSFHSFRHTFASRSLRSGMNLKVLSSLLGHSSIRVTMDIYAHVETEDLRKALLQMDFTSI